LPETYTAGKSLSLLNEGRRKELIVVKRNLYSGKELIVVKRKQAKRGYQQERAYRG